MLITDDFRPRMTKGFGFMILMLICLCSFYVRFHAYLCYDTLHVFLSDAEWVGGLDRRMTWTMKDMKLLMGCSLPTRLWERDQSSWLDVWVHF